MKKHTLKLTLALLFITSIVTAQPHEWRQGCNPSNPEMKNYVATTIIPLIVEQRELFEPFLNEEDRREIARIRTELPGLRAEHREMRRSIRESDEPVAAAQRRQMRDLRNQIEELMDEITRIAAKHEHELTRVLAQLRQDVAVKMDEKCPDRSERPGRLHREKRMRGESRGAGRNHESNRFHFHRLLAPEGFLLFDPARQNITPGDQAGNQNEPLRMNLFPNPASQEVQVSVMLTEPSAVKITLLDSNGNELRNVAEKAEEGMFSKNIDVSNLNDGLYIVKVEAVNHSGTRRLIVKR